MHSTTARLSGMLTRLGGAAVFATFCISTGVELTAKRVLPMPIGPSSDTRDALRDACIGLIVLAVVTGIAFARPDAAGVRALFVGGAAEAFILNPSPAFFDPFWRVLHIQFEEGAGGFLVTLACCATLQLSLLVPARNPLLDRLDALIPERVRRYVGGIAILYFVALSAMKGIMNVAVIQPGGYDPWYVLTFGLWSALLASALLAFAWSYRHPVTPLARPQLRWLFVGLAPVVAFGLVQAAWGALTGRVVHIPLGPYNGPLGVIAGLMPPTVALLFPLTVGLAVLRYRLFDVDRVLRLTVTWLLLAIVLLAGFVALAFVASRSAVAIAGPEAAADPASSVIAALLVAAVANPVHQRLVNMLDRLVFRARAARADLLEEAAEVLGRAQPPEVVGVFLTQRTPRRLGLQAAWVAVTPAISALADEEVDRPRTQFTRVSPDVAQRLASVAAPLVLTTAADRGAYSGVNVAAADDPALATLYASGARVLVPLRADARGQNRLVGVWALGSRSDVGHLECEDLQALDRVGKLAALLLVVQAEGRERERIQQELGVARVIQHTLLPPAPPCLPGWRIRAHYQAARQVGGDFYDFVALPGGRLGVAIGDVSGKGIPAALVMATTQSILRATAASGVPPCEVLERTNAFLRQRLSERMFVTCQYAVLDTQTGCLRYANAGHCPAYQRTSDRTVELSATGLPLGVSADAHYADEIIQLAPGDCLMMYSDGVVEARAPSGEMFGFNRLAELVAAGDRGRLVERILGNLERFRGSDAPPEDDVTLVILEHT